MKIFSDIYIENFHDIGDGTTYPFNGFIGIVEVGAK